MHILSLKIQGFKSYRDETVVDPFSPGLNIVVGRNGSGKSNFFSAVRFVLGDSYTVLSRDARQSLLHEGVSTQATLSAFVEIVFDNTDGRFPTGKDTVTLRRTVGSKKDEFSLDKKSANKGEVSSLLESAGFSKANPYYIVPQGRITHLTNQKDPERLDLLKEVAGTKVYEDRRTESVKIIQETDAKRTKIDELLDYIDERLKELEEEKKELKEYTQKDRERRCLEYSIYQKELQEVVDALDGIEDERMESAHSAEQARKAFQARQAGMAQKERDVSDNQHALELLRLEQAQLVQDRLEALKAQTELRCIVRDLKEASTSSAHNKRQLEGELATLQDQIAMKQEELQEVTPEWERSTAEERSLRSSIEDAQTHLTALFAKQGRKDQFTTQAQRDAYLSNEIANLKALIPAAEARMRDTSAEVQRTKELSRDASERLTEVSSTLDGRKETLRTLADEVQELTTRKHDLAEQRKDMWKEDTKLKQAVQHARDGLSKQERDLYAAMDRNTSAGLKAVARIAEEQQLEGVYGPLYSLFTVTDFYRQAAEVTAGNSLFHIVVDNDETATRVLDMLQREKAGRVTFMPLNRIKPRPVDYPQNVDALQPLIKKLQYDHKFDAAFQQVFSKTLVCQELEEAGPAMRKYGLTVITNDGDKVDRKGALTGGYHNAQRSRIQAAEQLKRWTTAYQKDSARHAEVTRTLQRLDQEITRLLGQIQIAESKLKQAQTGREPLVAEGTNLRNEVERQASRLVKLEGALGVQETDLRGLKVQLDAYQTELATPMTQNLSAEELDTMTKLGKDMETEKKELVRVTKACAELASRKNLLEIELNESLKRKREEVKGRLESITSSENPDEAAGDNLALREAELKSVAQSITKLSGQLSTAEKQVDALTNKISTVQKELEALQGEQLEDAKGISKQQKSVERYHAKRALLTQRKEECNNNIRDLGVLPEEAFEKYIGEPSDKLLKQLHKVNEALKKYAHVNKKAVEQFSNFTTQKESLTSRREELDKSAASIEELIEVLDQRKDEAIERTFKQVSKNFEEVFEKLVPAGRGRLIMQKRLDGDVVAEAEAEAASEPEEEESASEPDEDDDDGEDDEEEATPRKRKGKKPAKRKASTAKAKKVKKTPAKKDRSTIDSYTGVSIKVSFNSKSDEGLRIQQLSGGQKSLVALAVVFAIQKCDPAPFYLFDEIDANLDADRRTAIAAMIKELSEDAQFIITTFRPELLQHADNFLGVVFDARKISSIKSITADDATAFVEAAEGPAKE